MTSSDDAAPRRTVFLLGAGFSRAVSAAMPLMPELGAAIADRFRRDRRLKSLLDDSELAAIDSGNTPLGNVEVWLSALTTDQPFLTTSENLQRRALAAELATLIASFVVETQARAQEVEMPKWLARLVAAWHFSQTSVITLNYDTLIESAVQRLILRSGGGGSRAMARDVLGDVPPRVPSSGRWGHEDVPTLRIFKLHGSTNWFGRPDASDIFSVVRDDDLLTWWAPSEVAAAKQVPPSLIGGLSPLIMPPTANKAGLYANSTMAGIWQTARQVLQRARHVVVFGYSLPATDTSMRAFLSQSVRVDAAISIVDPYSDRVSEAMSSLGLEVSSTCEVGSFGFQRLVSELEQRAPFFERVTVAMEQPTPHYVAAQPPDHSVWPIVSVQHDGGEVVLVTEAEPLDQHAFYARPAREGIDLRELLQHGGIVVRFPVGHATPMDVRFETSHAGGTNVMLLVGHTGDA